MKINSIIQKGRNLLWFRPFCITYEQKQSKV